MSGGELCDARARNEPPPAADAVRFEIERRVRPAPLATHGSVFGSSMPSSRPPSAPRIVVAPERVERALRAVEERGRLEREFEVRGDLGAGGMGAVLRARDLRLCRDVAVKVLAPALRFDHSSTRRFVMEAQVVAQLEHPNIVPFYALACDDSGKPGFVMRLIGGESFRHYLDAAARSAEMSEREPHDLPSRLERFLKACDALEYAHARGVIHRDLKPENIMLGAHNEVYVVDWGLAKLLDSDERDSEEIGDLTAVGRTVGTPMYIAPEQARGERAQVGPASDQYALGLILQETATLRAPRRGDRRETLMRAAARGEKARFRHKFDDKIPPALRAIVAKSTAPKPADRYSSVAEFARDVRHFTRGEEVHAFPDSSVTRLWRRLRKHPELILGVILALTLVASASVTVALTRELSARDRMEAQSRRVASLSAQVARTAAAVDGRAALAEMVLEGIATAATTEIQRPATLPDDHISPADLAKDEGATAFLPRYHQRVSFDRAVTVLAPAATEGGSLLAYSGDFERILMHAAVRATGNDAVLGHPRAEQIAEARERASVLWFNLAFETGVSFTYPGNTFFPSDYDPRKRPWYRLVAGGRGRRWGSPHIDATSGALIIPCAVSLYNEANRPLGVAAVHLALDELLARIEIPEAEGFRESSVLDDRGDVVFSSGERGRNLGAGVHENRSLERKPFAFTEVRDQITGGARDGLVRAGDQIVVFQRLASLPWSLAVTFAAAPYDRR
jgi:serine/threonine-protein kinase